MDEVETLIVGAGVTGLATAAALGDRSYLVLEADREIGGYCKTIREAGFVWDYSGHFFHFKHPEIEAWLTARMGAQRVRVVTKRSYIQYGDRLIDFPFQKNIHQLPHDEFLECLVDLYLANEPGRAELPPPSGFRDMLHQRLGRGICEKFLVPYNEKLYACDLDRLDPDAMGRFFPHAALGDIVRHFRAPDNASYNATFTYPEGGAIEYVRALASAVRPDAIATEEPLTRVDLTDRVAHTPRRSIRYRRLVSSAPLPRLLALAGVPFDAGDFEYNRVLVFNLGFDRESDGDAHWIYYPARDVTFYRVGFYDNIFDAGRMSLYVELGYPAHGEIDVAAARARVLLDLERVGVVRGHELVASHSVVMDPAYVHVTGRGRRAQQRFAAELAGQGVFSVGRYGGWTYCSIEDNILEARALVERLG